MPLRIILILLCTGCTAEKWNAQGCNRTSGTCTEIVFGAYQSLEECVEKMKTQWWGFNCLKGCKDNSLLNCEKVMNYDVEIIAGKHIAKPMKSNPDL